MICELVNCKGCRMTSQWETHTLDLILINLLLLLIFCQFLIDGLLHWAKVAHGSHFELFHEFCTSFPMSLQQELIVHHWWWWWRIGRWWRWQSYVSCCLTVDITITIIVIIVLVTGRGNGRGVGRWWTRRRGFPGSGLAHVTGRRVVRRLMIMMRRFIHILSFFHFSCVFVKFLWEFTIWRAILHTEYSDNCRCVKRRQHNNEQQVWV